jgi:hypothetical protein
MKFMLSLLLLSLVAYAGPGSRIRVADETAPAPGAMTTEPAAVPELPATDEMPVMPGWPVRTTSDANFAPGRGVAVVDLDGDGKMEVIRPTTGSQVYVWRYDGTNYPGWPKTLSGMGQEAAAVADVDLDGEYEICVNTRGMSTGGKTYLFTEGGANKPGWPFTGPANGNMSSSPCLADVNGDDTLEIIVTERAARALVHVLTYHGTELSPAWPCTLDAVPTGTPAVADINLDGTKEIVCYSYNSLYAFRPDGTLLPGFPRQVTNANFSYQSPALADIDGDDTLEIIAAMHRNAPGCYVFRHDATLEPGWPHAFPRWTYCPPTVADLYRDGDLKVLCGLAGILGAPAQVLYAFDDDASVLAGFPITQPDGDAAEGDITVADIDGDEDMEVLFTSNLMRDTLGYLYAVHHDGTPVDGWPLRIYGFSYLNGMTVADVDGDDSLDIVAVGANGGSGMEVKIWETGVPYNRMSWEWPTYHFDMARTGRYVAPNVGTKEPGVSNPMPTTFSLSPNPCNAAVRVRASGSSFIVRRSSFSVYDGTGSLVLSRPVGTSSFVLSTSSFAPGIYFCRLTSGGRTATQPLIVSR